ncbi:MAG TPA: SCO family protein [Ktedonobacteraceae bacterium]|nr:SCO family protein [Ktedonobacteraceae bacterium]
MSISWRLASRLSVVTLALLVVLVVAIFSLRNNTSAPAATTPSVNESGLQGTDLGSTPAPDFQLKDQFGKQISLSQFKGKPVVLTFLYTHCPDVCPLIADKLHQVTLALGKDAGHVQMLAVSMDPKGDTQNAAVAFSREHKMLNSWHYLIGSLNQLAPIWTNYSVDAQTATSANLVTHSTAIYVIDEEGRERVLLDNDFTIPQLTDDLKILLNQ